MATRISRNGYWPVVTDEQAEAVERQYERDMAVCSLAVRRVSHGYELWGEGETTKRRWLYGTDCAALRARIAEAARAEQAMIRERTGRGVPLAPWPWDD